jgi:hypothetical protein
LWCKENGVTKYDTFTEIRLNEDCVWVDWNTKRIFIL